MQGSLSRHILAVPELLLFSCQFNFATWKTLDEKDNSDSQIGSIIYQSGPAGSFDRSARITGTVYRIPHCSSNVERRERREAEMLECWRLNTSCSLVAKDCPTTSLTSFSGRSTMAGRIQPLALIDKCIGSRIWIILKVAVCKFDNSEILW